MVMDVVDGGWARAALPGFFSPLEVAASVPTTLARAAELAATGVPEGRRCWPRSRPRPGPAGPGLGGPARHLPAAVGGGCGRRCTREAVWLTVAAAGVALAEAVDTVAPVAGPAALKWPNDLELHGRKAARAAGRGPPGRRPAGRGAARHGRQRRPDRRRPAAGGGPTGRPRSAWPPAPPSTRAELLAAWAGRFLGGYQTLCAGRPGAVLAAYRERLATVGQRVRADRIGADPVVGTAVDLTPTGGLVVQTASGARVEVLASDVHHLRPA